MGVPSRIKLLWHRLKRFMAIVVVDQGKPTCTVLNEKALISVSRGIYK
jgi:hypothetical protein